MADDSTFVTISLDGTRFETTRATLLPSPFFARLLAAPAPPDGVLRVDRAPRPFPLVLEYLRCGLGDMCWEGHWENAELIAAAGRDAAFFGLGELALFCASLCELRGWTGRRDADMVELATGTDPEAVRSSEQPKLWEKYLRVYHLVKDLHEPNFALPLPRAVEGGARLWSPGRLAVQQLFDGARRIATIGARTMSWKAAVHLLRHNAPFAAEHACGAGLLELVVARCYSEAGPALELLAELLRRGADANQACSDAACERVHGNRGSGLLHLAVHSCTCGLYTVEVATAIIDCLILAGASLAARDCKGETPLQATERVKSNTGDRNPKLAMLLFSRAGYVATPTFQAPGGAGILGSPFASSLAGGFAIGTNNARK